MSVQVIFYRHFLNKIDFINDICTAMTTMCISEDSSASLEMKDKLKALSQECLDLVDQVPYDFEIGGKAQR